MPTMHELFDGGDISLIPVETADEWLADQDDGVAACEHLTFARKVWAAAQQVEREACAKLCEAVAIQYQIQGASVALECAEAVRKRSNAKGNLPLGIPQNFIRSTTLKNEQTINKAAGQAVNVDPLVMRFFIVNGYDWGYGESSYFLVQALSMDEADNKVKLKLSAMDEQTKRKGLAMPCEVIFDGNGVSNNLIHVW